MRRIWKKMENMDDSGKEPPTGRTKLAVEPVSKITKNKPEGCIVFIGHLPLRTSPHVTLPIKEENEDNSPRHGVSLSIKEEYEYDGIKEEYVYDDTKEYAIKEEYEYNDTKKYTTKNVERKIEVTGKKGEKDKNEKVNIKNNITKLVEINPSKIRGSLVARKTCEINKRKYATTQKNDEQRKQTDNKGIDENILKKNQMKKSILLR